MRTLRSWMVIYFFLNCFLQANADTLTINGSGNFDTSLGTLVSVRIFVDPPATNTSNQNASHNHFVDPPFFFYAQFPSGTTVDLLPITLPASGNHTHTLDIGSFSVNGIPIDPPAVQTSTGGNHTHVLDVPPFQVFSMLADPAPSNTTSSGNHSHSVNIPGFWSGSSSSAQTIQIYTSGSPSSTVDPPNTSTGNASFSHNHFLPASTYPATINGGGVQQVAFGGFGTANASNTHNHSVNIPAFPIAQTEFTFEPFPIGDINRDGLINLLDVGPFIDILGNGEFQFEADCNGDGVVNLLDVEPFIDILGGG